MEPGKDVSSNSLKIWMLTPRIYEKQVLKRKKCEEKMSSVASRQINEVSSSYLDGFSRRGRRIVGDVENSIVTISYENGDVYTGKTEETTAVKSVGTLISKEGNKYEGSIFDGKRHGKGKETYPCGSVYEGDYFDNKKQGFGTLLLKNGLECLSFYEGEFCLGEITGNGKVCYFKDNIIECIVTGYFIKGRIYGNGHIEFLRNSNFYAVYTGPIIYDDYDQPEGTIIYSDGSSFNGRIVNMQFQESENSI